MEVRHTATVRPPSGVISVGTVPAPPAWLRERLAAFHRGHPAVRATVLTGHPEQLADAVATESLDLALVGATGPRQPAGPRGVRLSQLLGSSLVGREPLLALVPPYHPLAGRDQLSVRQLARHELVTLAPGSGLRAVLESVFADADLSPEIVAETDDLHELPDLVRAGLGVGPRGAVIAGFRSSTGEVRTRVELPISGIRWPAGHRGRP